MDWANSSELAPLCLEEKLGLQLAVGSGGDFPILAAAGRGCGCSFLWIVENSEPDEYEETCGDRKASVRVENVGICPAGECYG